MFTVLLNNVFSPMQEVQFVQTKEHVEHVSLHLSMHWLVLLLI